MTESVKKAVFGVIGAIVGYLVVSYFLGGSVEDKLTAAAEEINVQCPMMLDDETRLDSVIGGPGKKFTYVYTLVNHTLDDIDTEEFKAAMRPDIINNVRTSENMDALKKNDVEFHYIYHSNDLEEIAHIAILPADYK